MKEPDAGKWIITLTVMSGAIMSALDTSIVNVALPYMRGSVGASVEEITWVATGYMLSNVIIMPIIALLSARFGRKRLYLTSVFLFTLSSMLCGTARSLTSLVLFRVAQGIGGGALVPISQAILRETFPPEEQGMAMGLYGLGVVLGPAFGPTLGGWLTDHYSWPWIFYINVPVGIVNMMLVSRFIQDPPYLAREKGRLDVVGLMLMISGLGALQLMLEEGEREDWFSSRFIISLAVISFTSLALFAWRELTVERPAVDLHLLKNINFTSGTLIGGGLGIGLYASLFLLPLMLQQLLGYPALDSGLALMPRSLAMALAMPLAGHLYNRLGPRFLIGTGLLINAASFWKLSRLSLDIGYWQIFFPQVWQGIGFGMIFVALSTVALSTVSRPRMTAATGLYNVVRQVFGSIGIAVAATSLTRGEAVFRTTLVGNLPPSRLEVSQWLDTVRGTLTAQGADAAGGGRQALGLLDGMVNRQATMLSYNHVFFLLGALFILCLPLVALLRHGRAPASEPAVLE